MLSCFNKKKSGLHPPLPIVIFSIYVPLSSFTGPPSVIYSNSFNIFVFKMYKSWPKGRQNKMWLFNLVGELWNLLARTWIGLTREINLQLPDEKVFILLARENVYPHLACRHRQSLWPASIGMYFINMLLCFLPRNYLFYCPKNRSRNCNWIYHDLHVNNTA